VLLGGLITLIVIEIVRRIIWPKGGGENVKRYDFGRVRKKTPLTMTVGAARRGLTLVALRLTGLIGFERVAEPVKAVNETGRLPSTSVSTSSRIFCAFTTPPTLHSLRPSTDLAVQ